MSQLSMVSHENNEQFLINSAQSGDLDAFNTLVLHYQNQIYTAAYRIMGNEPEAADVAQDTFITAFRRLDTFRGGNFKAWLLRIVTNQCYDALRREKRRPATSIEDLTTADTDDGAILPDHSATPEQVVQQNELNEAIQECINQLPHDQRVALIMCDVQEMNYQEIADANETNLGTIKSRLSRARAAVRECLQAVQELLPSSYRLNK